MFQSLSRTQVISLLSIDPLGTALVDKLRGRETVSLRDNRVVIFEIAGAVILQIVVSQWSLLNTLFETALLNLNQWLICLLPVLAMLPVALLTNRIDRFD